MKAMPVVLSNTCSANHFHSAGAVHGVVTAAVCAQLGSKNLAPKKTIRARTRACVSL